MKLRTLAHTLAMALIAAAPLEAAVPQMIGYQGQVKVSGAPFTGNGQFKFAILNRTNNTTLWSNDGTSVNGSAPNTAVALGVTNGLFNVLLGDTTLANMQVVPDSTFTGRDNVALRVWFNDGVRGWEQLTPDSRLGSVPFAMSSHVPSGSITAQQIAPGTIDPTRLSVANSPQPGRVLSYDNGGFNWLDVSAANNVWFINGTTAYYNAGKVGIGTAAPAHQLGIVSGPFWTSSSWLGALSLENAGAIGWGANAAGQRFGMGHSGGGFYLFRTASDPGDPNGTAIYDFTLNDAGYVGIGTTQPTSPLHVHWPSWSATAVPNVTMSGENPALLWSSSPAFQPGREYRWLALHGNSGGLEFYHRSINSTTFPVEDSGWVSKATLGVDGSFQTTGPDSVSHRLQTTGGTNAWTKMEFANANGQWNVGTSRGFNNDQFYFHRQGATVNAFAIQPNGDAFLQGTMTCKVLTITGADLAEKFPSTDQNPEPGMVMEIDPENPGRLRISREAYCARVAGVVSGAGDLSAGAVLGNLPGSKDSPPIALSGRVWVQCDADTAPIHPGDILTTSSRAGFAMKALDRERAQGAVLGKAMTSLTQGTGLVLVLVTLQ